MTLATINSIWIGPKLGPIHAACLRSFARHGHRTILHVYEQPVDVPDGIELSDANDLLSKSRMIRHSVTGSPAIFSDLLRYEILKKGLGLYVDCDCYCLRPIEDTDYIFGFESTDFVATGVLKLPPDCPVVEYLCRLKDERPLIPPWASAKRQLYYRWRARLWVPVKIQDMPWGFAGPQALTWYLKQGGLERHAEPIDVFYPVHFNQTALLLDADLRIDDITTRRTRLLHLSNEKLKRVALSEISPSSPLGMILAS
jgi:hypothetical protein